MTRKESHWLSPELGLEFPYMNGALEFSDISKEYNGEIEAWDVYVKILKQEGRKLNVMGGKNALQDAMSKKNVCVTSNMPNRNQVLPLKDENDDECFICGDGGGEKKKSVHHKPTTYHTTQLLLYFVLQHWSVVIIAPNHIMLSATNLP